MNKSKFKSVKFLPFDLELYNFKDQFWTALYAFGGATQNTVRFTDSCIEQHPELFDVEKAEREFEEGAYYKAMFAPHSVIEIIQRFRGKFQRTGLSAVYIETDFHEIGEKIEL